MIMGLGHHHIVVILGFSGGLDQTFRGEVYNSSSQVVANLSSSQQPTFHIQGKPNV